MEAKDKKEKRGRIIEAAATVFAEKGYARTSMSDIAGAAGIAKGTTYEYFESKEALFFAVFEWYAAQIENIVYTKLSADDSASCTEKIRLLSDSVLESLQEMEQVYPLTLEFWSASASSVNRDKIKPAFRDMYRQFSTLVGDIIKQGMETGEFESGIDPYACASALVGAWDCMGLQAWFDEDFDMEKTVNAFTALVTRGLTGGQEEK